MKTLIRPRYWSVHPLPRLRVGDDETVSQWTARHIPQVDMFGLCTAIGVERGDRLIAGCVYHDYQPSAQTIQLSFAAAAPWWTRYEIVRGLLHYPFMQLEVYRAYTLSRVGSPMSALLPRLGFSVEAVLTAGFGPGKDAFMCRMLKPDYSALYEQSFNGNFNGTFCAESTLTGSFQSCGDYQSMENSNGKIRSESASTSSCRSCGDCQDAR